MPHIPRKYKAPVTKVATSKAPLVSQPASTLYDLPVAPSPLTQSKPRVQRNPAVRKAAVDKKPLMPRTSLAQWDVLPDDVLSAMELE